MLTELTSPLSLDLSGVDDDHLGVGSDGLLWHDLLQLVLGLLGHVTVDLLTALLRLALEVAFLDLDVDAGLDGLDELLLGVVALVDHDRGGGLDLSLLVSEKARNSNSNVAGISKSKTYWPVCCCRGS